MQILPKEEKLSMLVIKYCPRYVGWTRNASYEWEEEGKGAGTEKAMRLWRQRLD